MTYHGACRDTSACEPAAKARRARFDFILMGRLVCVVVVGC